jgi:F0F1-type ATP synthase membrane subunit b/b'
MPQFDTFIFSSSLFYFIISFFTLLYLNYTQYLPRIGSLLKLRHKLIQKPVSTKTNTEALNNSGMLFTKILSNYNNN